MLVICEYADYCPKFSCMHKVVHDDKFVSYPVKVQKKLPQSCTLEVCNLIMLSGVYCKPVESAPYYISQLRKWDKP